MMDGQTTTHAELFDLTGKSALVTGGTRGIGMMMARGLLQAGARRHQLPQGRCVRAGPGPLVRVR
jgi:hypothetical protein